MRIAVVDDQPIIGQGICEAIKKEEVQYAEKLEVNYFCNGRDLLEDISRSAAYEMYFLDMEMPDITGLELTEQIQKADPEGDIVHVSAHERYVFDGLKKGGITFVRKIEYQAEIPRVLERFMRKRQRGYILLNEEEDICTRIKLEDIIYIRREKKKTVFYCKDGQYTEKCTLNEAYQKVRPKSFAYISKSEIVNLYHVERIGEKTPLGKAIVLTGGVLLYPSRRMFQDVQLAWMRYWGG